MSDIRIGLDILKTEVSTKTGSITAQLGDVANETVHADNVQSWGQVCFLSRPSEATKGVAACQAIVMDKGGCLAITSTRDLRGQLLAGSLAPGEFCVYAPGQDGNGQARIFGKKDGSLHLYTKKGNVAGGAGMTIQIDAAAGAIRLLNDLGHGIIIDADGVKITAGASGISLGADGNAKMIATGQAQIDGAGIVLGSVAVVGVNSAITGVTGVSGKASLKVVIE